MPGFLPLAVELQRAVSAAQTQLATADPALAQKRLAALSELATWLASDPDSVVRSYLKKSTKITHVISVLQNHLQALTTAQQAAITQLAVCNEKLITGLMPLLQQRAQQFQAQIADLQTRQQRSQLLTPAGSATNISKAYDHAHKLIAEVASTFATRLKQLDFSGNSTKQCTELAATFIRAEDQFFADCQALTQREKIAVPGLKKVMHASPAAKLKLQELVGLFTTIRYQYHYEIPSVGAEAGRVSVTAVADPVAIEKTAEQWAVRTYKVPTRERYEREQQSQPTPEATFDALVLQSEAPAAKRPALATHSAISLSPDAKRKILGDFFTKIFGPQSSGPKVSHGSKVAPLLTEQRSVPPAASCSIRVVA